MAKSYRELTADMVRRGLLTGQGAGAHLIDAATRLPERTVTTVKEIPSAMKTKADVIAAALQAKLLIRDKLSGEISDEAFAYQLATDANVRKTVNNLSQKILQPTPVTANPNEKGNSFLNFSAGVSAYWSEMTKVLPIELETAISIEGILTSVNIGMDTNLDPEDRKTFLKEAGLSPEQIDSLIPRSDYRAFEDEANAALREQIIEEFGLARRPLNEEEQLLVDSVLSDRVMAKERARDLSDGHEPTYEEVYGISASDLYDLFGDEESKEHLLVQPADRGINSPVADERWEYLLYESGAMEAYDACLDTSMEDTLAMLYEETFGREQAEEMPMLTDQDLAELDGGEENDLDPDLAEAGFVPMTEEDLQVFNEDGMEQ